MMNSRERVLRALNREEPDRIPICLSAAPSSMTPTPYHRLKAYLGIPSGDETISNVVVVKFDERILRLFDVDFRCFYLKPPKNWAPKIFSDGTFTDEWGVRLRMVGDYAEMVDHPLKDATVDDLQEYRWPDPHAPGRTDGLEEDIKEVYETTDYAIDFFPDITILERCWYLRGLPRFLRDFYVNSEFAETLLDKVLEIQKGIFEEASRIGKYFHIVRIYDDLATQNSLIMSPALYRRFVKPRQRELIRFIKARTKAKVLYHTCGAAYPLINDLIEIGVDVLNSMQPRAHCMGDSAKLNQEFAGRISFLGGIDIQHVLPFGSPTEVEEEVKKRIRGFAPGGGYILATAHNIQADVPPENIVALFNAAKKYGKYPRTK